MQIYFQMFAFTTLWTLGVATMSIHFKLHLLFIANMNAKRMGPVLLLFLIRPAVGATSKTVWDAIQLIPLL